MNNIPNLIVWSWAVTSNYIWITNAVGTMDTYYLIVGHPHSDTNPVII